MSGENKRFVCEVIYGLHDVDDAAEFGWDDADADAARALLDALAVGETIEDDDGDTWERVQ